MKYLRNIFIFVCFFIISLISPTKIFAVTVTITSFPGTIASLDPFQVGVYISGATNATNYLRVDLYKDRTTNYFGETYNGTDWYGGSDGKNYFPVQIQNSTASATLQAQIGNPSTTEYPGPGTYKLKIRRYTSSGSQSTNDTQTPVDVQITYATPSPTPTQAPTTAPTSASTATSTPAPTPTKTPTPKPTVKVTPTSSPQVLGEEASPGGSLTDLRNQFKTPTSTPLPLVESSKNFPIFPAFLIVGGLACIGFAGFSLVRKIKTEYNGKNEEDL